jgi:hypothetical protein
MLIIKDSKQLAKLVNEHKDLIVEDDVRIEFSPTREELRDVTCWNLEMKKGDEFFDFTGGNFNGWNFTGRDFNGWNFNGKKVSYYAFFNCCGDIRCESIEGWKETHAEPVSLTGVIEIGGESKKMTIQEISEELGYKVEVVEG